MLPFSCACVEIENTEKQKKSKVMISLKEETFLFVFEMLIKFNFENLMQKPLENDEQNLSKVSVKLR